MLWSNIYETIKCMLKSSLYLNYMYNSENTAHHNSISNTVQIIGNEKYKKS